MPRQKRKVLFVGSFKNVAPDGSVGGQMFASKSLINSPLRNEIDFVLIDSTADSVPAPHFLIRLVKALKRLIVFVCSISIRKIDVILIFSADGFSFIEKGAMALIGKLFLKRVIFCPRSGLSKDDYERSRFMREYMRIVIKRVDYVICQGTSWKKFYQKVIRDDSNDLKFIIQQNWLDVEEYVQNQKLYLMKDSSRITLMYLGWLEEYKGIFDIIDAVREVRTKGVDIELNIYGSGSKLKEATELVADLALTDIVHFNGWANQLTKLKAFSTTDIYVLPSHREGFPNSLLEAMASGLPVVATNVGAVGDILKNYYNGILVDQSDTTGLSKAICRLAKDEDLRRVLGANARETILANNSVQIAYKTFSYLFSDAIN